MVGEKSWGRINWLIYTEDQETRLGAMLIVNFAIKT
jgi:hypothetical protein